jgi:hypothetical protein
MYISLFFVSRPNTFFGLHRLSFPLLRLLDVDMDVN